MSALWWRLSRPAGLHPSDYLLNPDTGVKWFFSTRSINSVTAVGLMTSDLNRDVLWCGVKGHISSVSNCQRFSHSYILYIITAESSKFTKKGNMLTHFIQTGHKLKSHQNSPGQSCRKSPLYCKSPLYWLCLHTDLCVHSSWASSLVVTSLMIQSPSHGTKLSVANWAMR